MQATGTVRPSPLRYGDVEFTHDSVNGVQDARVYVRFRRDQIRHMHLRHGLISRHPILQVIVGIVLASPGVRLLWHLINWFGHGGTIYGPELWLIATSAIGVWVAVTSFSRGFYLEVASDEDRRRLSLPRSAAPAQIAAYFNQVERDFGYRVVREVPDVR
jgi:hypothetical protein